MAWSHILILHAVATIDWLLIFRDTKSTRSNTSRDTKLTDVYIRSLIRQTNILNYDIISELRDIR